MPNAFTQRAFGCAIIKSVNANYNADFTHQPRTLPDGRVYATDKALKYTVRNYLKKVYPSEKVFFFKSFDDLTMQPKTLVQRYTDIFKKELPKIEKAKKDEKKESKKSDVAANARREILTDLLSCLDIRLFGATFAPKESGSKKKGSDEDATDENEDNKAQKDGDAKGLNLSLHGPVQITHGINRHEEGRIYSEQIMSPFRNPNEKSQDAMSTTLGTQFKLSEGHYVHHFSVNPHNLTDLTQLSGGQSLTDDDVKKLKEGLSRGATLYDSAAKSGTENELLLWVQLKLGSMLVLPSFVEKVSIGADGTIDLSGVSAVLDRDSVRSHIEKIEIYRDPSAKIGGVPAGAQLFEIHR